MANGLIQLIFFFGGGGFFFLTINYTVTQSRGAIGGLARCSVTYRMVPPRFSRHPGPRPEHCKFSSYINGYCT